MMIVYHPHTNVFDSVRVISPNFAILTKIRTII